MCGIFGFIGRSANDRPNMDMLHAIAAATQTRGRHAFGLAWIADGGLGTFKREGSYSKRATDLDRYATTANVVIGHCRWTTHGHQSKNENNHPHACGRGWLVHNGMVHNYLDLADIHEIDRQTECDTEVLGKLVAKNQGPLLRRIRQAVAQCDGPLAILTLSDKPRLRLGIARRGNPLSWCETQDGIYLASLQDGMRGEIFGFADSMAAVLERDDRGLKVTTGKI